MHNNSSSCTRQASESAFTFCFATWHESCLGKFFDFQADYTFPSFKLNFSDAVVYICYRWQMFLSHNISTSASNLWTRSNLKCSRVSLRNRQSHSSAINSSCTMAVDKLWIDRNVETIVYITGCRRCTAAMWLTLPWPGPMFNDASERSLITHPAAAVCIRSYWNITRLVQRDQNILLNLSRRSNFICRIISQWFHL